MPRDSKGNFHLSNQQARHADKKGAMASSMKTPPKPAMSGAEKEMSAPDEKDTMGTTTLHDHGDGSFSTESDGEMTEHPTMGHALMHMASKHEPEGKHMHVHADGGKMTSHHTMDGNPPEGPNEHADMADLQDHMSQVLDDEGAEKYGPDHEATDGSEDDLQYGV